MSTHALIGQDNLVLILPASPVLLVEVNATMSPKAKVIRTQLLGLHRNMETGTGALVSVVEPELLPRSFYVTCNEQLARLPQHSGTLTET